MFCGFDGKCVFDKKVHFAGLTGKVFFVILAKKCIMRFLREMCIFCIFDGKCIFAFLAEFFFAASADPVLAKNMFFRFW